MKPIRENDTIQIEVTSFCPKNCSNCTRFCGHYKRPWFMTFDEFKRAVDSLADFQAAQGVGMMGGEPVLHPQFEQFCDYMASKIPAERCGIWTCCPDLGSKEKNLHAGEIIARTFGTIFPNDHTRPDVLHHPFLVSIDELINDQRDMDYMIDRCWAQKAWSASVNPNGAFFCEIAASLSMLFGMRQSAWTVEKGWWHRTPIDYWKQIEEFCHLCGGPLPVLSRYSVEEIDDISPKMLSRLQAIGSPKIKRGEFKIHNLQMQMENRQMASYKDQSYREGIIRRYGLFLVMNTRGFIVPFQKIIGGLKVASTGNVPIAITD